MKKLGVTDILETDRCTIKLPQESEAEYMWWLITESTTKYMIWTNWKDSSKTLNNIKETLIKAKEWKEWQAAIYLKDSWELIWRCWINKYYEDLPACELWYWVSEKHYGKWFMPECVKKYLEFAFQKWLYEKVIIRCDSKNINSEKVALKCWFTFEWEFKKHERIKWELRDTKFFWITKEEYFSNH